MNEGNAQLNLDYVRSDEVGETPMVEMMQRH